MGLYCISHSYCCIILKNWYKGVGGKLPSQEYQDQKAQLEELKRLDDDGKIDLYYLDETGFCLLPCVPYGWQDIGEYLTIIIRRSQRKNVLGIMNQNNPIETNISSQSINSLRGYCLY